LWSIDTIIGSLVFDGAPYALEGNQRFAIFSVAAFFLMNLVLL
jgi:hypothetical protein